MDRQYLGEEILSPIVPSALPESGQTHLQCPIRILLTAPDVGLIAHALITAKKPLVIAGYLGRNPQAPPLLAELCDKLPISVLESVGSDMSMRTDHEAYLGVTITTHVAVSEADVILILDCDVPWIPTAGKPRKGKIPAPSSVDNLLTV